MTATEYRRVRALIRAVCRYFMNFLRTPSMTRARPQMTTTSPAMPTTQRPAGCCMTVPVTSCCRWRWLLLPEPEITSNVRTARPA